MNSGCLKKGCLIVVIFVLMIIGLLFSLVMCSMLFGDDSDGTTKLGKWELCEYTDKFDRPTGKKYISLETQGTYTTSVKTDGNLKVILNVDGGIGHLAYFVLYCYSAPETYSVKRTYTISILTEGGIERTFNGTQYAEDEKIYIENSSAFKEHLMTCESIRIHMRLNADSRYTYSFTIDASSFNEAYDALINPPTTTTEVATKTTTPPATTTEITT